MKFFIKLLLNAVAIVILSKVLNGIAVDGYTSAIIVAAVLALLNAIVKPILIILTFPITIVTLGLFLFAINASIILLADQFITGFVVSGFWMALWFSILLSVLQSFFYSILKEDKKQLKYQ